MSAPYASSDNGFGYGEEEDRAASLGPDLVPEEEDRHAVFMPAVQQLVNALGGYEEVQNSEGEFSTIYRPGDSVLAVLKDLKKLWRKDDTDDERTVARCMAQAGLMRELISLVRECTPRGEWGRKVALMAFDLVAALTWPIDVAAELKEMDDNIEVSDYASLLRYQVEYKAMLVQGDSLRSLLALLIPCFANPRREDKEERVISLGLYIVRNLLAIKDVVAEDTATGEKEELSTLQSALILQLSKLTYLELFLTLGSEPQFDPFNMILLDIVHLMFRSVKMEDLGMDQKRAAMENLTKLLELERREKTRTLKGRSNVTRHSRFGTTIAVRAANQGPMQKIVLHSQSAITADPGKLLDQVKKGKAGTRKTVDDMTANLSSETIEALQKFARDFLDCFNDFFATVLKDIQMERSKVRPADTGRALFVSRFLMEYLLILRKKALARATADVESLPGGAEPPMVTVDAELPLTLAAQMVDMMTVRWVSARMKMAIDETPISWNELQASINCFTQILLLLDGMVQSSEEEDKEIAEILQNQIYHNGDILDLSFGLFTLWTPNKKDQPVSFLDCIVHFAYVLLRMLEKYSKSQAYMFVRKRKRANAKRKAPKSALDSAAPIPEEYAAGSDEDEEEADADAPSYAEHAFTFTSYEKRFATEHVTSTLMAHLARYHDFTDGDKVRWIANLMHRQVVKAQAEGLYYKVTYLDLFRKILNDKDSLPKGDGTKDLLQLIMFLLRKFFKCIEKDPFVIVDALLPKGRGQWQRYSSAKDEDDDGMAGQRSRIREKLAAAELEFIKKNNLSWSQQMGVVVSILVSAEHKEWVRETVAILEIALASRQEVVLRIDGDRAELMAEDSDGEAVVRNFSGPSKDAIEKFEAFPFAPSSSGLLKATTDDKHVKLMLKLLHFEREDEEQAQWILPSSVLPSAIETSIGALNQFLEDPPEVGDTKTLLRPARRPRARAYDSDEEEDPDRPRRQRARKVAEMQNFKSAAFIYDSDDDEDADAAFFAREAQLRAEMEAYAEANGNTMRATGTKKRKRKGKGGESQADGEEETLEGPQESLDSDDEGTDGDDEGDVPARRRRKSSMGDVSDNSDGDLPPRYRKDRVNGHTDPDTPGSANGQPSEGPRPAPRPRTQRIIESDDE